MDPGGHEHPPLAAPTTDAAPWSGFKRRRTFFSTLPATPPLAIPPRPTPWDPGWGRRHHAPLPPMQRSRGPGPRASTYQYQTSHLLFRLESAWLQVPDRCLHLEIRRRLPAGLTRAWQQLALNLKRRDAERLAEPAAEWLAVHGPQLGARTPNTAERGRAAGISDLCQALLAQGLTHDGLFDAQGNACDIDAFRSRVQAPLLAWLGGAPLRPAPRRLRAPLRPARRAGLGAPRPPPQHCHHARAGMALERFLHLLCGPGGRP